MEFSSIEDLHSYTLRHFDLYKTKPGSQAIASEAALLAMVGLATLRPPQHVLEIGAGLGTITNLFSKITNSQILAVETVEELCQNLKEENLPRVTVVSDFSSSSIAGFAPDWVIFDGPCQPKRLLELTSPSRLSCIVVENQRLLTRIQIASFLFSRKLRFNYSELDSMNQTGLAAFLLQNSAIAPMTLIGSFHDYSVFALRVMPRFIRQSIRSRGRNFLVGQRNEGEHGLHSRN